MTDFNEEKNDIDRIEYHKWGNDEEADLRVSKLVLDTNYIKIGSVFRRRALDGNGNVIRIERMDLSNGIYIYISNQGIGYIALELLTEFVRVPDLAIVEDNVNHPKHYTAYKGIEVIELTQHLNFCRGNVVKYVARAEHKGNELEDLKKALWYLNREISLLEGEV